MSTVHTSYGYAHEPPYPLGSGTRVDSVDAVDSAIRPLRLLGSQEILCPHFESAQSWTTWTGWRSTELALAGSEDTEASRAQYTPFLSAKLESLGARRICSPEHPRDSRNICIVGPPGCGKTTLLHDIASDLVGADLPPNKIEVVSFSRSAIQAFRTKDQYGLFTQVRTVYSLAHHRLKRAIGRAPQYLGSDADHARLLRQHGIPLDAPVDPEIPPSPRSDLALAFDLVRHVGLSLGEVIERMPVLEMTARELKAQLNAYLHLLSNCGVVDYAGLLEAATRQTYWDGPTVVLLDEAQDFSPLEWAAFDALTAMASLRVLVGDPAQAIHGWRGCRVQDFEARVERAAACGAAWQLIRSHRNPAAVTTHAAAVLGRCPRLPQRLEVEPRNDGGVIRRVPAVRDLLDELRIPLDNSWLILARNRRYLRRVAATLDSAGIAFGSAGGLRLGLPEEEEKIYREAKWTLIEALVSAIDLSNGETTGEAALGVLQQALKSKAFAGGKRNLPFHGLEDLDSQVRADFDKGIVTRWLRGFAPMRAARIDRWLSRQGSAVVRGQPTILLMTIHASKGLEADNVIVLRDWSRLARQAIDARSGEEHRLAFVAVTRAREAVYIVEPGRGKGYPFPPVESTNDESDSASA